MDMRNVAIIAHVDHGKTTLIDRLLAASGAFRANQQVAERALDSNDLERERGITILAKVTSIEWKGVRINIVDTPGHADFGGEVERIMGMVDGAILLIDAAEGVMPQTKFVLAKALSRGLKPIVAVNKIDKPDERHDEVVTEAFDLFVALGADEEQLDFPVLYGSAKQGWMAAEPDAGPAAGMDALLDLIIAHVPPPRVEDGPFRLLGTMIEADPYLGRLLTGRIVSGSVRANDPVKVLDREGNVLETGRVAKVLAFRGLARQPIENGEAGDIVAIAGLKTASVAHTLCAPEVSRPLPAQPVDPPTLSMTFRINDGPLAGREGDKVQSRVIRERLYREMEGNVAIRVEDIPDEPEAFRVSGRGELQLAVLIETLRREGFELTVGRPRVLMRRDDEGRLLEPVEEAVIDVDEEYAGVVVQKLSERRGRLVEMLPSGTGRQRLIFHVPTRGLIGYQPELMSDTRGTAVFNRVFHSWQPWQGEIRERTTGALISNGDGEAVAYALWNLEDRGPLFIGPGDVVYRGMIVGEHTKGQDLEVNVLKGKKLTNIRAAAKDDNVQLTPPVRMTLERALSWIADDELVEVTPKSIRLRKAILDPHERKRAARRKTPA
ncbi:translational GTPase TypA [Thermopetrobacter sp. TC1]|uniref:translational GTPase TypA n=1 Tax=Thermopetrobacter sp. TC1 TaxID=1495045 RepID=UPI00056F3F4A|nr:translational GTPase TypA [Thermopetrobacter sp. TC1]